MAIEAGVIELGLHLNSRNFLVEVNRAATKGSQKLNELNRQHSTQLSLLSRAVSTNKALLSNVDGLSKAERRRVAEQQKSLQLAELNVRTAKQQIQIEKALQGVTGKKAQVLRAELEKTLKIQTEISRKKIELDFGNSLSSIKEANNGLSKMSGLLKTGIAVAGTAALVGVGAAAAGVGVSLTKAFSGASNAQAYITQLKVLTGSLEEAKKVSQDVASFAANTPFELPEVQAASQKLLAFGVNTEDLLSTLKAVGDVSAAVGAPFNEIADIYGKIKTQNTVFNEDLNQLAGRGIPIIQELAKQFNVTEAEIKKMSSEGKITFKDIETAFQNLTGEGGKFNNMMGELSKTLQGKTSNLTDTIGQGFTKLGESLTPAFEGILDVILEILGSLDIDLGPLTKTAEDFKAALEGNPEIIEKIADLLSNEINEYIQMAADGVELMMSFFGDSQNVEMTLGFIKTISDTLQIIIKLLGMSLEGWTLIVEVVRQVASWIGDKVFSAIGTVNAQIKLFIAQLEQAISFIKDGIVKGWDSVSGVIGTAGNLLKNNFLVHVNAVKASFEGVSNIINNIVTGIGNAIAKAKELASNIPGVGGRDSSGGGTAGAQLALTGNSGRRTTGAHLDVRKADGSRITTEEIDRYFDVSGKDPSDFGVTSGYGNRRDPINGGTQMHRGIDFATPTGLPITANQDVERTEVIAGSGSAGGLTLRVYFKDGSVFDLLHLSGTAGQGGSDAPGIGGDPAKVAYDYFRSQGASEYAAAMLAGNIQQESGFNPGAVGDGGRAVGLFQWHPDRRDASFPANDFQGQLEYAWNEFSGPNGSAVRGIDFQQAMSSNDPTVVQRAIEAAIRWGHEGDRWSYGQQYLNQFQGSSPTSSASGSSTQMSDAERERQQAEQRAEQARREAEKYEDQQRKLERENADREIETARQQRDNELERQRIANTGNQIVLDAIALQEQLNDANDDYSDKLTDNARAIDDLRLEAEKLRSEASQIQDNPEAAANIIKQAEGLEAQIKVLEDYNSKLEAAYNETQSLAIAQDNAKVALDAYSDSMERFLRNLELYNELSKQQAQNSLFSVPANLRDLAERDLERNDVSLGYESQIDERMRERGDAASQLQSLRDLGLSEESARVKALVDQIAYLDEEIALLNQNWNASLENLNLQAAEQATLEIQDFEAQARQAQIDQLRNNGDEFGARSLERRFGNEEIYNRYQQQNGRLMNQFQSGAITAEQFERGLAALREMEQIDLSNLQQQTETLGETIANRVGDGIQGMLEGLITGTKTVGEAFRDLFTDLAAQLAKVAISRMFTGLFGGGGLGGFLGGLFGADGHIPGSSISAAYVPNYADGNVGGIIAAAARESSRMPSGASLVVANSSEAILNQAQQRNVAGALRSGGGNYTSVNQITIQNTGPDLNPEAIRQIEKTIDSQITKRLAREKKPDGQLYGGFR